MAPLDPLKRKNLISGPRAVRLHGGLSNETQSRRNRKEHYSPQEQTVGDPVPKPTRRDHLRGKPDSVVDLYRRFEDLIKSFGPARISVTTTAITFSGSRRLFAGARLTGSSLTGFLDTRRVIEDPRILRASPHTRRVFTNHFRVTNPDELDEAFRSWIREAYAVGEGKHLLP